MSLTQWPQRMCWSWVVLCPHSPFAITWTSSQVLKFQFQIPPPLKRTRSPLPSRSINPQLARVTCAFWTALATSASNDVCVVALFNFCHLCSPRCATSASTAQNGSELLLVLWIKNGIIRFKNHCTLLLFIFYTESQIWGNLGCN